MSPVRWDPDDPRWLSVTPELRVMDAAVLRQVGVPEGIIVLATRDVLVDSARSERAGAYLASGIPFDDVDEPYWEDETVSCHDHRRW
jgi:hypothetical protein